jgi:hypothetical protein
VHWADSRTGDEIMVAAPDPGRVAGVGTVLVLISVVGPTGFRSGGVDQHPAWLASSAWIHRFGDRLRLAGL